MTPKAKRRIEQLRDRTDADSLSEVIRNALAVYEFLWDERKEGGRVMIFGKDGSQKEVPLLK